MSALRHTLALTAIGAAAIAAPAACFFPSYSFDETPSAGGSGPSSSSSVGPGGSSTSSTGGAGPGGTGPGGAGPGGTGPGGGGSGGEGGTITTNVGGSGGQGGGGTEICDNGVDDNADGKIDCGDPTCTAFACVPSPPATWTGYFAVYDGPLPDPGCPADYPGTATEYLGNAGLMSVPATCSMCGCAGPTMMTCKLPGITVLDAACGMQATLVGPLSPPTSAGTCFGPNQWPAGDTSCGPNGMSPCNVAVTSDLPTVTGGSCTASGGTPTKPPPTWAKLGHGCGDVVPTGALGCNVNQVCLPRPEAPFESGTCIMKDDDQPCPPQFPNKHLFYESLNDTRGCTNCGCGAPSGATCSVSYSVYSDQTANTCNTELANFTAGGCASLGAGNPAVAGRKATITQPPTGGSCSPNGGQPTGMVTEGTPTTFCCIP